MAMINIITVLLKNQHGFEITSGYKTRSFSPKTDNGNAVGCKVNHVLGPSTITLKITTKIIKNLSYMTHCTILS